MLKTKTPTISIVLLAVSVSLAAAEPVVSPKVVTDKSVDCSSIESIVRDIVKPGMTDRQKFLALYHWFRRVVFHYRMMGADRRDVLRVVNSYGCDLCGSQAAVFRLLCSAAGLKVRVTSGNGGKELGHTVVEVWYDGRWHVADTMTSFYVLTRDNQPTIASMDDIARDPTLVTKAVEQGRCGPEFLYCRRQTEVNYAKRLQMMADGMTEDIAWTLFVIAPDKDGAPRDIMTFWTTGPKQASPRDPEDSYGARYEPGLLDIALKPNEEYVRLWDNTGKWVKNGGFDNVGPYHTCGNSDEFDPINFSFYEPYKKENVGYAKYAYRYFANGWLDWKPERDEILVGAKPANLALDNASSVFQVIDSSQPASLWIPVKSPYAVVQAALEVDIKSADPQAMVSVTYAPGDDSYHRNASPQTETVKSLPGVVQVTFDQGARKDVAGGVFQYGFKVEVKGGRATFSIKRVKTTFMLNMYSLPYFTPGMNTVTVSAAKGGKLNDAKLLVAYDWAEGPGWKVEKSDVREFVSFPASYRVKVAGPGMPRMKRLVLKVVPAD